MCKRFRICECVCVYVENIRKKNARSSSYKHNNKFIIKNSHNTSSFSVKFTYDSTRTVVRFCSVKEPTRYKVGTVHVFQTAQIFESFKP